MSIYHLALFIHVMADITPGWAQPPVSSPCALVPLSAVYPTDSRKPNR
jgi:hypothetical protein